MKIIQIKTEEDFYKKFLADVINSSFQERLNVVYRGQFNSNWGLLSNIHRSYTYENWSFDSWGMNSGNTSLPSWSTRDKTLPPNSLYQATVEVTLLSRFLKSMDESDFSISELNFKKELFGLRELTEFRVRENDTFPFKKLEDLSSIAQHYGIPTRMLDWSKNYLVGLFFAIDTKDNYISNDFSVFTLETNQILQNVHPNSPYNINSNEYNEELTSLRNEKIGFLNVITPPYHLCPNMKAQRGVLTYVSHEISSEKDPSYDLIDYINNLYSTTNEDYNRILNLNIPPLEVDPYKDVLCKYVFDKSLIHFLRKYLYAHNIHEGTIFPGLNGIASHAKRVQYKYRYTDK
ncbi:MAG: hypothetical protein COA88_16060 [Kordia sp.]|nr:MAG: hypothetical protein COA88_16060 [Kordia sp.]